MLFKGLGFKGLGFKGLGFKGSGFNSIYHLVILSISKLTIQLHNLLANHSFGYTTYQPIHNLV